MKRIFSISMSLLALVSAASPAVPAHAADSALLDEARAVVQSAAQNALALRQDGQYWNIPSYLGSHFISQYFFLANWLGQRSAGLDPQVFKARLLQDQLQDGSWYAVPDTNLPSGDLNATILNYWALKAMGASVDEPALARARAYILAQGGIERSSRFTKIVLALYRNVSWDVIPDINYVIFTKLSPINNESFAQWVGPHLIAIAYLRHMRLSRDAGPAFKLDELWASRIALRKFRAEKAQPKTPTAFSLNHLLIGKILDTQRPAGSWGAYTVATLFSSIALAHYSGHTGDYATRSRQAIQRGLKFAEEMYFGNPDSAYRGSPDDGRYWDTALIGAALAEAGVPMQDLAPTGEYLSRAQVASGGLPFGLDFEYAPDTDDTAEMILFMSKLGGRQQRSIDRAVSWLSTMQNDDGGWGAFARNNTGNALLKAAAKDFEDSADLFDESSADVTGHILEAFGSQGLTVRNSAAVRKAVGYLRGSFGNEGAPDAWSGRWGINYLYGTGAALVGLLKVGESAQAPYVQRALIWLLSRQNVDGGFGETSYSYTDPRFAGVGRSTPSQTAWALLALIEAGEGRSAAAERAAAYLVREFRANGRWIDSSTVGTGHPGVVYMNYPSYPYSFTLQALARYERVNRSAPSP